MTTAGWVALGLVATIILVNSIALIVLSGRSARREEALREKDVSDDVTKTEGQMLSAQTNAEPTDAALNQRLSAGTF